MDACVPIILSQTNKKVFMAAKFIQVMMIDD